MFDKVFRVTIALIMVYFLPDILNLFYAKWVSIPNTIKFLLLFFVLPLGIFACLIRYNDETF